MSEGFFERVYRLVRLIPPGRVATYGQVADLLGRPRAARIVGWALHGLRDGQHDGVPWQRVVGAGGRITLPDEDGGAGRQRTILLEEGILFDRKGTIDMALFRWDGPEWPEMDALLRE